MLFEDRGREKAWDVNLQLLLVLITGFNVLPHISSIPIWTTGIAFLFLGWKMASLLRGVRRPPRALLYLASVACAIGIFNEYHTILGQEAASALLVTLASAKLLETNRYRDAMFVIFTAFFLLMAHLLDSQTILTTIYMACDVMLITALMFQLHKQERRRSARSFRPVMKTLLLAIPVWIFLFVAFPRFSAGFWGQQPRTTTGDGFSEDLDPGSVSSLVQSEETAFHVTFSGASPSLAEMYWRGGILTVGNGLRWKKSKDKPSVPDVIVPDVIVPKLSGANIGVPAPVPALRYQVFLEPRFQSWIFALDYPLSLLPHQRAMPGVRRRPGFIFENNGTGSGQFVYDGTSAQKAPTQHLGPEDRAQLLQLPEDLDPRVRELGERLAREARSIPASARLPSLADRIGFHVEAWFDAQGFRYTKEPGILKAKTGSGQLTEFLFEKKRGFCEHYAASFATLMRAAGVPARVTVGFLGAAKNTYSDYFIVRDLDAHAWAEIWRDDPTRPGTGRWVRIDPTALIAPLRLQMGGDFNLLDPASYGKDLSQAEAEMSLRIRQSAFYYKASLAWDALQMKWNSFLNDYDFEFQKSFLERLGLRKVTRWLLLVIAIGGSAGFAFTLNLYLRRRARRIDPVLMGWRELCRKLERAGLSRSPNEGPLDFAARASRAFPAQSAALVVLGEQYATLRYGPALASMTLRDFRQCVGRLKLTDS